MMLQLLIKNRITLGKLRRIVHYEFWPPYIFYFPLILYLLYLSIKYRSFMAFTAVNPGIENSGLVGESKAAIFNLFEDKSSIAKYELISTDLEEFEKIAVVKSFVKKNNLEYPIVLKPNIGQRGSGVLIIKNIDEATAYLKDKNFNIIVQEFIDGIEFGVFYYRYPGDLKGKIYSITEKIYTSVIGDGESTLKELILNSNRGITQLDLYLERHKDKLEDVLELGQEFKLVDIGTHCRGSLFLDGAYLNTDLLLEAINNISRKIRGFYFGRFDIKVSSKQDLENGINLKILELNGVGAEATHIYDPKLNIFSAYKSLFKQWKIAYEIGKDNIMYKDTKTTSLFEIFKVFKNYELLFNAHPGN